MQDLKDWFKEAKYLSEQYIKGEANLNSNFPSALKSQGWIKNGWTLSFYFLMIYKYYQPKNHEN